MNLCWKESYVNAKWKKNLSEIILSLKMTELILEGNLSLDRNLREIFQASR